MRAYAWHGESALYFAEYADLKGGYWTLTNISTARDDRDYGDPGEDCAVICTKASY